MRKLFLLYALILTATILLAQQALLSLQEGNDAFKQNNFEQAEIAYRKILKTEPGNTKARYNLGLALYRQDKINDAKIVFDTVAGDITDNDLRPQSYYNKGVVLSKEKKLEESIEAYKQTLRMNPKDNEARENLQKALLELKKKDPPKKKENKPKPKPQQQPQSRMNQKEAERQLDKLQEKEKQVQQKIQQKNTKSGGSPKDW